MLCIFMDWPMDKYYDFLTMNSCRPIISAATDELCVTHCRLQEISHRPLASAYGHLPAKNELPYETIVSANSSQKCLLHKPSDGPTSYAVIVR